MKVERPLYRKGEFNCAETIIDTFNQENGTQIPVALGSGMGSGLTTGSICGAVNAAALIIGFLKGRNNKTDANEARAIVNQFMKIFKEKYGSEICIDLKKSGISCEEIVEFAYDELNKLTK
jgi:C_GCAxxG_C_C family probable redox protein